jgi:hypothetical protein
MDTIVFITVLFSAILHAIWNSMASKYKNKNVSIPAIVYGHVPACIIAITFLPAPSIESFPFIINSSRLSKLSFNSLSDGKIYNSLSNCTWIWSASCNFNFNYFFRGLSKNIYHFIYFTYFNRGDFNWSF